MIEHEREIRDALKQSFPLVNIELQRDLWPAVLRKLDANHVRVPWYDWVLVGLSVAALMFFPRLIFLFAYHL